MNKPMLATGTILFVLSPLIGWGYFQLVDILCSEGIASIFECSMGGVYLSFLASIFISVAVAIFASGLMVLALRQKKRSKNKNRIK